MTGPDALTRHFRLMARNNAWANNRLLTACCALGPGEFTAPRSGFFPSLRATLTHSHAVDLYYIGALRGSSLGPRAFTEAPDFPDPAALRRAQADTDHRLTAFCDALTPTDPDRAVPTDRGADGIFPETIANLLAHLFQHQIHHRGQAHAMLSGTSVKPPQLDEFFLDYDRDPTLPTPRL